MIDDAPELEPADLARQALEVLHAPGDLIELRALHTRRGTQSGYYRDREALVRDALRVERHAAGVYVTLAPVAPALHARACERLRDYARETTMDADALARRWVPVDCDPVRPSGISSTDDEHAAALARAPVVRSWLITHGVPTHAIILADSGNGSHLLIRADIAADAEGDALVRDILAAVDLAHTDAQVSIDVSVVNRSRIWRLYGTLARKGDSTPERPHRRSRLLKVPERIEPCPVDVLRRIAALAPRPVVVERPANRAGHPWAPSIDLGAWVRQNLHVHHVRERPDGSTTWVVRCPWREHGEADRAAYVMRLACGAIAAGCLHNHCRGESWRSLRALYNPTVRAVEAALLREGVR